MNGRRVGTVGLVLCALAQVVAATAAVAVATAAQQADPPTRRSVWDRVFTEAQAGRGEEIYGRQCVECHGSGLDGDAVSEIPALAGDPFMQRWSTRSLDELVAHMQRSMPPSAPGSLTRAQYVDLAAHLLKSNGFPSGFDALGTDSERLRQIVIQRSPGAPR